MFAGVKGFFKSAIAKAVDQYFNLVTLLLNTTSTNGAQNNTFLDSSSNNFTITRNGNTTQGTFTPFSQTGWGNYFDGSSYLATPASTNYALGSGNYTIELWFYATGGDLLYGRQLIGTNVGGSTGWGINIQRSSGSYGLFFIIGNSIAMSVTADPPTNVWNHVAIVRNGTGTNNTVMYLNGVAVAQATDNTNDTLNGACYIGGAPNGGYNHQGYISNARYVKGTAVYTSSFTPPTVPLTAITNTQLLTSQSNRFLDNSSNAATISVSGSPSVQAFSPFAPSAAYSAATNGGAGYFDGSGDYLNLATQTAFDCGTGNWTLETWVYITTRTTTYPVLLGNNNGSYSTGALVFGNSNNDTGAYNDKFIITGYDNTLRLVGATTNVKGTWYHVAVVRDSSTSIKMYVNGVLDASNTSLPSAFTFNWGKGGVLVGGGNWDGAGSYFNGYLYNMRLVKGVAVYSGAFTPPTKPITTDGATSAASYPSTTNVNTTFAASACSLLLNFTNGGIFDQTGKNALETVGNAQISTSVKKYGTGSMYFDGAGDYLQYPDSPLWNFGSSDFTIEFWVYPTSFPNYATIISKRLTNTYQTPFDVIILSSGKLLTESWNSGTAVQITSNTVLTTNTWTHVAVVRNGTSMKMYFNGVADSVTGTYASGATLLVNTTPVTIGQDGGTASSNFAGYLDDMRITRYARYTANFTPPTAAFADQ